MKRSREFLKSASDVLKSFLTGGPIYCSEEVRLERRKICGECEHRDPSTDMCNKCGCALRFKTTFATTHCPLDKWGMDGQTLDDLIQERLEDKL